MARAGRAAGLVLLPALLGGCNEEEHGFLKIGANALFNDGDSFACGEAKIVPKEGGFLDAFVTLKPQDCVLTLHRAGDFMGFGTKVCDLHIGNNRITTVYLNESRGGLTCGFGSS